ncbi:hypothetical protein F383_20087 [Gossypium arboreum]|uniref:Uncharacterized protein n=1 Tax=Gossypium arboreum TaxID=29729 RepID=A0A0B0NM13_GOSAR|nr:hypothetical protein F383_20086 [Gossypium arboreum]KHG13702.1 hypothetical protein F383_20087 [Gossypium arboreum]
MLKIVVLSY